MLEDAVNYPVVKMRTPEAAQYLRIAVSTLARLRVRGDGPAYSKIGTRIVLYDQRDLDAWTSSRRQYCTSSRTE